MQKIIKRYILIICGVLLSTFYANAQDVIPGKTEYQNVAFGKQLKNNVTGAVFTISGEELLSGRTNNLMVALQGRLPGLRIIQTDAEPGRESYDSQIRGYNSPNANGIMYVVDGVERNPASIDVYEVESVTVLKDAAATSMFGMRASSGALLITTKRGLEGKSKITVSVDHTMQSPTRLPNIVNAGDYAGMYNQRLANDTTYTDRQSIASGGAGIDHRSTIFYTPYELDRYKLGDKTDFYPVRNMVKDFLKDFSTLTRVNVNFIGGSSVMRYFTSIGYTHQGGLFQSTPFAKYSYDNDSKTNRFNFRTNLDVTLNKNLDLWFNIGGYMEKVNLPYIAGGLGWNDLIEKLYQTPNNAYNDLTPTGEVIVKRDKLSFATNRSIYGDINRTGSQLQTNTRLNNTFGGRQKLDDITPGLSASAQLSFDIFSMGNQTRSRTYEAWEVMNLKAKNGADSLGYSKVTGTSNTVLSDGYSTSFYYMYNMRASLDYSHIFGDKHCVNGLLMGERHMQQQQALVATNYLGLNGRVAYGYDNRLFAEANFSFQGSEQFDKGNRYGFFPSLSASWLLSNEKFLKDSKTINYLKLRASAGQVGNNVYGYGAGNQYLFLDTWNTDAQQTQLGNPQIRWETSTKYNFGIESKFFNALTIQADLFYNKNTDIIIPNIAIIPQGFMGLGITTLPPLNLGENTNKGFELVAGYNKKINSDLSVNFNGNLSFAQNKQGYMAELAYGDTYAYPYRKEGYPINENWGYRSAGIFNNQQEINAWPNQSALGGVPIPGDIKYVDLNKDGIVDPKDQAPIGIGQAPELTYGFRAQVAYKLFDFTAFFDGAARRNVYLNGFGRWANGDNFTEYMKNAWTPALAASGQTAVYPRLGKESSNFIKSDFWMADGAYFRFRNIEIGFTLPKNISQLIGSSSIRFYANGLNLMVWDKLPNKDFDPESANSSTTNYPLLKSWNFGVSVKF
jgi:TonB-linked SusC/RagA family outer membrane protein